MLLLANLDFPALPEQTVTVAVTHLESSASPKGRRSQMREVLSYLQPIKNPVILGGDLNTSGVDRARGEKEDTKAAPPPIEAPYSELPNPEKEMLWDVACLRFADNRAFDFRGDRENSANGSNLLLANSNETTQNGFAPTFELQRTLGNFGKFKLDWIFVKGYLQTPLDKNGSYRFAPHFGRVFRALNYSSKERISDHSPLIVDLPLVEPREKN
jgi:endonuclease/exonuclease/phosphatase family metal-dependent hydrolase